MPRYELILATLLTAAHSFAATYPVDCAKPEWKTLDNLKQMQFKPGDQVLLKSGCAWKGQLAIQGSGAEGAPIVVSRFGNGAMPRIDANGAVQDAILIKNQEWIEVRNIEATNTGASPAVRRGVHIWLDDFGTAKHIVVSGLYIHDVNGDNARKDNGGIIFRTSGKTRPSRFDGLVIEKNIVWKVDRSAIAAASAFYPRTKWFPSLNVAIRDNYVDDIGGDGIVPWACDGAVVEHNVAKNCNMRARNYNAGIWPWSCDNTVLRWNEASFTRDTRDGQGFDSDFNSRNTLFEYNYSHDNEGGFMLVCSEGDGSQSHHAGNTDVTIRYNISRNDKTRSIHLSGPVKRVHIHDNVVYIAKGDTVNLIQTSNWKGWPDGVEFRDNTFLSEGTARYGYELKRLEDGNYETGPGFGPAKDIRFTGNVFAGNHENPPADAEAKRSAEMKALQWKGPDFDPAHPEGFEQYLHAHRLWMKTLMQSQFGAGVN